MDLKLTVHAPGAPPAEYAVGEQAVVLGRDASCDVPIPSQYVSRRHCQVEPTLNGWDIVDLGGRNPVILNGAAISERAALNHGDSITIADVTIDVTGDQSMSGTVVFQVKPAAAAASRPATSPGEGIQGLWRGQNMGPGGTVTIMFTDLERSTSMVTNLGEREAYKVTTAHNAILREQFATYRGHEAKRMG